MKFQMKHILLRKDKRYTEDNKVFLLYFSKSSRDLLQNSNIFTRKCIIPTCVTLIKNHFKENLIVHVPHLADYYWTDEVLQKIDKLMYSLLTTRQSDLCDKIHRLEGFYSNWGWSEIDFKKYGDLSSHFIPYFRNYYDVNDLIKDMNIEFDKLYKEEL